MTVPAVDTTFGPTRGVPMTSLVTAVRPTVATLALARVEARLLLRSATLWISVLLATALGVASSWTRMQTWETFAQTSGVASLVLAGGLLIAGHLAAGRDHRSAMTETTRSLPTLAHQRIAALLVYVPVAIGAGFLAAGVQLLFLMPYAPVGKLQVSQVVVAVVIPPLGALTGLAVGRRAPAAAVGPLALVAAAVLVVTVPGIEIGYKTVGRWLGPVVTDAPSVPGVPQPHGTHLIYLLALLTLVTGAALMRRDRRIWALVATLALGAAGGAAVLQINQMPDSFSEADYERYAGPASLQCQSHSGVRYCALHDFGGWVPLWRDAVERVVTALPTVAHDRLPSVRQIPDATMEPEDTSDPNSAPKSATVTTGLRWGRHGHWAVGSRSELVLDYARAVTRLPVARLLPSPADGQPSEKFSCSGHAQPRTVVALWLVAQALPDGADQLATRSINLSAVQYGQPETDAAAVLLQLPRAQVTAALAAEWPAIISAKGGTGALDSLGVRLAPAPATQLVPCK